MARRNGLGGHGHSHQIRPEDPEHPDLGRGLEMGPGELGIDALGASWAQRTDNGSQSRGPRVDQIHKRASGALAGVDAGERRAPGQVEVVADRHDRPHRKLGTDRSGGAGEDGGVRPTGDRGPDRMDALVLGDPFVEVGAAGGDQHPARTHDERPGLAAVTQAGEPGEPRQRGEIERRFLRSEERGDPREPRTQHDDHVVTLHTGAACELPGSQMGLLEGIGARRSRPAARHQAIVRLRSGGVRERRGSAPTPVWWPSGPDRGAGRILGVDEDGFHPPLEEYLETVHSLTEEGTPVIQARIAERLGRSAPSVSEMLDRLEGEGYVRRSGRVVQLTDSGSVVAEKVVRRHRLAERLLVDVIGLEWHKVHLEAGRWEHVISDDVEARLVELLGDPATCPHGNPIPGSSSPSPPRVAVPLALAEPGQRIRLERISEDVELDTSMLTYLSHHGFVPGATAQVSSRAPDGTLVLALSGTTVAFGPSLASRLYVSLV